MKFNFRKIASVLAGVVMLGSTVGIAAAANYPAPFVAGGAADVAVVYGATAGFTDGFAAYDLQSNLQYALGQATASGGTSTGASATGGDSVNLATSTRKVYYADAINAARTSLSSTDMPTVLADGKVVDLSGVEYKYTQSLVLGSTVSAFDTSGGDLNDPALYLDVGITAGAPLYNYTVSFLKNLNVSDATNVQGQKINILGVDYIIGSSSTNSTLYLYGSGEAVTLTGAESKTVTIAGVEHTIELVAATATTTAKIAVDGVSKTVTKGSSYSFAGDINVYVKDVTFQNYAGGIQNVELIVGANTLVLGNGVTVKQGASQTAIQGTNTVINAAGVGLISGFTVQEAEQKSSTDNISPGTVFIDPVFGGLQVQFAGLVPDLNSSARSKIVVETDNNQYGYVTFTSARAGVAGEQKIKYVYDNDTTSTAVQPLLAYQTITSNNQGAIHVLEGENALLNDAIVVNQGDAGTILKVSEIDSGTAGVECKVKFQDLITGDTSDFVTLTNDTNTGTYFKKTGVNFFGGNGYTVMADSTCNNPTAATTVNVTWNSAGTRALFPRIKLANGGWIALLTQTSITNASSIIFPDGATNLATLGTTTYGNFTLTAATQQGIIWTSNNDTSTSKAVISGTGNPSCNFNRTMGPAILYLEPKKWNDATYGNYICVPLKTSGTTEIGIGDPVFNGTGAGNIAPTWKTYNSDSYKKATVDQFGTYVTKEDRTNENGVATIYAPQSQMYLDVLFTSVGATVTPGASTSGSVADIGNIVVKDSEVSSVSTKNLIVVGGSCINTVAQKIVDSTATAPICGAAFTTATGVGANQALIKVVTSPYAAGKVAMLVAGYEATDTTRATKWVTTENPVTDAGTTKTLSTSTDVVTVVTTA